MLKTCKQLHRSANAVRWRGASYCGTEDEKVKRLCDYVLRRSSSSWLKQVDGKLKLLEGVIRAVSFK